jgi:FkbM family methyltransferase
MNSDILQELRFKGYAPHSLLDIGAHVGTFTRGFLEAFPACVPTLIEPNPFCHEALEKLPYERHAVAASSEGGKATLFLTKEWLQSTGSSLYRENTAFFRDEVVIEHEVEKVRLDDLFRGRRFDFVKIDTQGAELDVLMGGEAVLRHADYILVEVSLVEFNAGAPPAEAVFAMLTRMGFRQATVTEFHRLQGVNDGGLLQMDFLFERETRRAAQACRYAPLHQRGDLAAYLQGRRARCDDFSVLGVGGGADWLNGLASANFDARDGSAAPIHFSGALSDPRDWEPLLRHVSRHGRFAFAVLDHGLASLANPATALEMLPHVAEAGFVATASRYLESLRPEGPYRGFAQHRWVLDAMGEDLVLAPKPPLLEHMALAAEAGWAEAPERFEFQLTWRGAIAFHALGGERPSPAGRDDAIGLCAQFFDRP